MKRLLPLASAALLLLAACGERSEREESLNTETFQYAMPSGGEVRDAKHGKEQWFAYGSLDGVNGSAANGVAKAHQFEDGSFLHTVQLNIEPPEEGYFYEGWLVNDEGDLLSTGHLTNNFGDARHSLRFESEEDLRSYTNVIITLEPDDGNPDPAEHVAEGILKETER